MAWKRNELPRATEFLPLIERYIIMSVSESLIRSAVNNWSPWETDSIEDIEVSNRPIDGEGSPYRVFVTYKDSEDRRTYHRTFYATIKSGTCKLEEDEEACLNAECYCMDGD